MATCNAGSGAPNNLNLNPPIIARVPTLSPAEEREYGTKRRNNIAVVQDLIRQAIVVFCASLAA